MVLCKLCDNLREYIMSLDFQKVCVCFFLNLRILSSFFCLLLCKMQPFSITNDVMFYPKRHDILPKTTCRFTANNVLFYPKRRVVLPQTTCCFTINDVLFCYKRRVVSLKMNICFWGCCDTCDSKKTKKLQDARVLCARVRVCCARR